MALEKRLSDALGLDVTIEHRGKAGVVSVRYRTLEQLDEVVRRLGRIDPGRLRRSFRPRMIASSVVAPALCSVCTMGSGGQHAPKVWTALPIENGLPPGHALGELSSARSVAGCEQSIANEPIQGA